MTLLLAVLAGLLVGVFSGLVGVGGGVIMVPILVYAFHMTQHDAQGTSLAMLLPPTGLLAFMRYYKEGHADLKIGLAMAAGIFIGGYFGGGFAQQMPSAALRKVFAVVLAGAAVKMFFQK